MKICNRMYIWGFFKGFCKAAGLGYLFYKNVLLAAVLGGGYGIYSAFQEKKLVRLREESVITRQFREGLQGIAAALKAGYSIENAFGEAKKDLQILYGEEAVLVREFGMIQRQLALNEPIESVLSDFAERWRTEDILHFVQVFHTAKRTGGNLVTIMHSTAEQISQKLVVKEEIEVMIAGKKLEGSIMNVIPLVLIVYFWICSPGFLDCMYEMPGTLVMTVLLGVYLAAFYWNRRICDIQV